MSTRLAAPIAALLAVAAATLGGAAPASAAVSFDNGVPVLASPAEAPAPATAPPATVPPATTAATGATAVPHVTTPAAAPTALRPPPARPPAAPAPAPPPPPSPGGAPTLLSPDEATTLASETEASGLTPTTVVDGRTALAASSTPGSDTVVEPDLSSAEAVGLASPASTTLSSAQSKPICWSNAVWHQWGWWPYEQRLTDTTYWCAIFGHRITYKTSSVTTSGTLCGTNWRQSQLIGGGIGFPSFAIRSSAGFACPTDIPWIALHPSRHEDVLRDARGGTLTLGTG